jgi:single-strand DNA-binding protein
MFNKVILIGNLTRDVELKYTPSGTAIAKFGLATNRTYKDSVTGENKQEVMFIDITVFGRSAEIANQYLAKGRRVLIEGRLILEQWVDSSGQKRSRHSVIAERVQFMDSKSSSDSGYNQGGYEYQQPQPTHQPQPQKHQDVPEIDIDEDEIPF